MLRIIFAGVAAVAIGTAGGLTLVAAKPARDAVPQAQLATTTTEIETVAPTPKKTDPVSVSAPTRTAEALPAPAPQATPGDDTLDKILAATQPGPVIARESLATATVASVTTVGSGQPTRATASVAPRAAPAAPRSYAAYGPAGHPLMLGIGY
jgi:hypothetical protein